MRGGAVALGHHVGEGGVVRRLRIASLDAVDGVEAPRAVLLQEDARRVGIARIEVAFVLERQDHFALLVHDAVIALGIMGVVEALGLAAHFVVEHQQRRDLCAGIIRRPHIRTMCKRDLLIHA